MDSIVNGNLIKLHQTPLGYEVTVNGFVVGRFEYTGFRPELKAELCFTSAENTIKATTKDNGND